MSKNVSAEINELLDAEKTAEAAVPVKAAKKVKEPRAPREPKQPEGPNPYGIHNRVGTVITLSYLKKYAQCATRGMLGLKGTEFSRADNISYFMSPEFLEQFRDKTAGEYSQACRRSNRWGDETVVPTTRVVKAKAAKADPLEQELLGEAPLY